MGWKMSILLCKVDALVVFQLHEDQRVRLADISDRGTYDSDEKRCNVFINFRLRLCSRTFEPSIKEILCSLTSLQNTCRPFGLALFSYQNPLVSSPFYLKGHLGVPNVKPMV